MTKQPQRLSAYRLLLGEAAWNRLNPAIRRRFDDSASARYACYDGIMFVVRCSFVGWLLAQCCRLIGTPLALHQERNVAMRVRVYPDEYRGGLTWDRHYRYRHHHSDRVRSTKRLDVNHGLMEVVGGGFGMLLAVTEEQGAIRFCSTGYFWQIGRCRVTVPQLLTPGMTTVLQQDLGGGQFRFTLDVEHPMLGQLFYQDGVFWAAVDN